MDSTISSPHRGTAPSMATNVRSLRSLLEEGISHTTVSRRPSRIGRLEASALTSMTDFPELPSLEPCELSRLQVQALAWEADLHQDGSRNSNSLCPTSRFLRHSHRDAGAPRNSVEGYATKRSTPASVDAAPPTKKARRGARDAGAHDGGDQCCICMTEPTRDEVSKINGCDHLFCYDCIGQWAECENTCPLCKQRFTHIERVHAKRGKDVHNSKRVEERDQQSDIMMGSRQTLEQLLASVTASRNAGDTYFGRYLAERRENGSRTRPPALSSSEASSTESFSSLLDTMLQSTLHSRYLLEGGLRMPRRSSLGNAADRPLPVDDDDDSDDEVEIVQVSRIL